jgi:hypothetical protein
MKDAKDAKESQVARYERKSPNDHENLSLIAGALLPLGRCKLRCNERRKNWMRALKFASAFAKASCVSAAARNAGGFPKV